MTSLLRRMKRGVYMWHDRKNAALAAPFVKAGEKVLDFGCGDGIVAEIVAGRTGAEITCVDVIDNNLSSRPIRLYDGRRLPFKDREFDASYASFVLHHCDDPDAMLRELKRGTLISAEELRAELSAKR